MKFNNSDLEIDKDKIKEMYKELHLNNIYISIEGSEDKNLDFSFGLDVEDTSYWYLNEEERNNDLIKLWKFLKEENNTK